MIKLIKMNYKIFRCYSLVFLVLFLSSCSSVKETFTKKKSNNSEEFLIEKKSPLVMPPDFDELPIPSNNKGSKEKNRNIQQILGQENQISNNETLETESSIEKLIFEKIKKD